MSAEKSSTPQTVTAVLVAISCSHLINDTLQAIIPSIYPMLKESFSLTFAQLGYITLVLQCTASLMQPVVGLYTDRRPLSYSLAVGMGLTLLGLAGLALAPNYPVILAACVFVGLGSAIFHPEASRIAHMAAGNRRGFAQSFFQLGGNAGTSLGPLLAAAIVVPRGQASLLWFCLLAFCGMLVLQRVGRWQGANLHRIHRAAREPLKPGETHLSQGRVVIALTVLLALVFSKYIYLISLTNYYTFYLIDKFHVSVQTSQLYLFVFLFSVALGTILGGPLGDKFGRKKVIWCSILGVAPFTLWLPHASLAGTAVLTVVIGVILASAFSAILVFAQELVPGKVGLIAGLFFGAAFGIAGIGSAVLGHLADLTSIEYVFQLCAYLPLLGILTILLPDLKRA